MIQDVAPLFDHELSLTGKLDDDFDRSAFLLDSEVEPKHFEIFEHLCKNYPVQISVLMSAASVLDFSGFVSERFDKMVLIYEKYAEKI
jgi:hypothetical protein